MIAALLVNEQALCYAAVHLYPGSETLFMAEQTAFSTVFLKRVDDIERRALRAGTSLTAICKGIGISRATPDRWRREVPRTIEIVDEMERWMDNVEKKRETVDA